MYKTVLFFIQSNPYFLISSRVFDFQAFFPLVLLFLSQISINFLNRLYLISFFIWFEIRTISAQSHVCCWYQTNKRSIELQAIRTVINFGFEFRYNNNYLKFHTYQSFLLLSHVIFNFCFISKISVISAL